MTRLIVAACVALSLSGCVIGPSRRQVLDATIGRSETDLVRQFGVPTRTYEAGGHHFLAYVEHNQEVLGGGLGGGFGGFGPGFGPGIGGVGGFYGGGFPAELIDDSCETTIEVQTGIVRGWALHGRGCA